MKEEFVELEREKDGVSKRFPFSVAEKALKDAKYIRAKTWKLPDNSKYKFNGSSLIKKAVIKDK